jgi:hypothetical protein
MPWVNGRWVPEDDSSVTGLNKLTASDSPYITLARKTGMETANSRGLINSSIAAGTSQAAAIAAAAPFALQDANNTASKNLAFEQAGQASDLSAQDATQASALSTQQAGQALTAQTQSEKAASGLSAQEYTQQGGLLGIQGTQAKDLANLNNQAQAATTDKQIAATSSLADTNNAAEMARTQATLASTERTAGTNALLQADANYETSFGQIAGNENIPAETRDAYLANIQAIRTSSQDAIQQMYGVSLNWGTTTAQTSQITPPAEGTASTSSGGKSTTDKIISTLVSPISSKTGRSVIGKVLKPGGLLNFL